MNALRDTHSVRCRMPRIRGSETVTNKLLVRSISSRTHCANSTLACTQGATTLVSATELLASARLDEPLRASDPVRTANSGHDAIAVARLGHALWRRHVVDITAHVARWTTPVAIATGVAAEVTTAATQLHAGLHVVAVGARAAGSTQVPRILVTPPAVSVVPTRVVGSWGDTHYWVRRILAAAHGRVQAERHGTRGQRAQGQPAAALGHHEPMGHGRSIAENGWKSRVFRGP
jgi:hypothetical protein